MDAKPPTSPSGPTGLDAYKPAEIARLIETAGVAKTRLPLLSQVTLGGLAGAFISLGALFFLVVLAGADPGYGPVRYLGGIAFSLGLVLVIVGGAELFTGNTLLTMAWVDRLVSGKAVLRNWVIIYFANAFGAMVILALAWLAGLDQAPLAAPAAAIAEAKLALGTVETFARAILCNVLVCLAVWLAFAARDAAGKVVVILFPIPAFVALGFEHCIANMFILPFGILAGAPADYAALAHNLFWATLGNIVGGGGGVALSYWAAYRS
ncbi:MAG: formate/nitrite transporter family protein [Alphaproteobacteria bacterium]|nr:formate/nitrite transporter family protein [Alphaproteobacteria bacterium]